jgi:hypothetical protein
MALALVGAEARALQVAVVVHAQARVLEPLDKPYRAQRSWCLLLAGPVSSGARGCAYETYRAWHAHSLARLRLRAPPHGS